MNRKEIKKEAKEIIKTKKIKILLPYLAIYIITLLLEQIFGYIDNIKPLFIAFLIQAIIQPLYVGFKYYLLKMVRKEEYSYKDIYSFYDLIFQIFLLFFIYITGFTISFFFLIVPGLIIMQALYFSFYIMADGEENPIQAIKQSIALINGYKLDHFKFQLTFMGWFLIMPFAFWYLIPYMAISETLYYEELKKVTKIN